MNRILISLLILFTASVLYAQIPRTISYQGILTDNSGNPKPDGDYEITFNLYEEANSGVNAIWTETKTLNVTKGLFLTSLGDQTSFGSDLKFDKPYFLGIKVGDETEFSPRIALTSSGYSLTADNVVDGKVVKSLNGLKDSVTLEGGGGTTINTNGSTITISSSGSGGTGIQGIQNTNNTIDIEDPTGPTATVNLKVPLHLSGSTDSVLFVENTSASGYGIKAVTGSGIAVYGISSYGAGTGVYGKGESYGVFGSTTDGEGVIGLSVNSFGVFGRSEANRGIMGYSTSGTGVYGQTNSGYYGIYGYSPANVGVGGESDGGYGLLGKGHGTYGVGVYATSDNWYAGDFQGNVNVTGTLSKSAGSFKIDHPLDPANKYLSHSFVESPDMMNIYNGNATTDADGNTTIILPDWFEALNKDFRYQLTTIGQQAEVWIEREIHNNNFVIKTNKPNVKVSWQITGIRNDPYAKTYPIIVEQEKEEFAKGKYLSPELYGQPKEIGIHYVKTPEMTKRSDGVMD